MNRETELLKFQNFLSFLFIISIAISMYLVYNKQLKLENKKYFLSDEESKKIIKINRYFVLTLLLGFLYINYQQKEIHKNEKTATSYNTEIAASYLSILAVLAIIYGSSEGSASLENPEL